MDIVEACSPTTLLIYYLGVENQTRDVPSLKYVRTVRTKLYYHLALTHLSDRSNGITSLPEEPQPQPDT